ncbi:MAG: glycosyltransferase [Candidatus Tectomicrobia bacterium]|uniref:Glycosyltransferase n=1 Tax=Tectimicrobiota bacterium TaxID=2528274 RepID=A0A932GM63_UNCTE|nr:glycosyltransferase [Candidatus Tectomicrobia bacterium]
MRKVIPTTSLRWSRDVPQVSVVIPTYNRRHFLPEAVASVRRQTYRDWELIIVDDGSEDGTREMLEKLGGPVRLLFTEHRGVSAARNRGLAEARGKYIAYLDSDDLWHPHKLQIQVEYMEAHPAAVVTYTDEIWIRRGVRVNQKKKHRKYSGDIFAFCLPLCIVSLSSALLRRDVLVELGGFDETLPACEDYDLWLRLARMYPFHFEPRPLITKRGGHPDQLSRSLWGLDRFRVQSLDKFLTARLLTAEQREQTIRELQRKCRILIQGSLKRGQWEKAEIYEALSRKWQLSREGCVA